jgi:hypothetical protein
LEIEIENRLPKSVIEIQRKSVQIRNLMNLKRGLPQQPEADSKHEAREFLKANRTALPFFRLTGRGIYNGIVVEVDDDYAEAFLEKVESAGFQCGYEEPESIPD